ncbi:hypothetical protein [Pseudoalteromonas aliena]|uniref:hypothetical protein n=1 Tax=Pseudoalteromonas aliena TaxID=247523 RepID=UPI002494305A|nr:hypothetical protein [Pseudoalteromonas aliena]
MKTTIVMLVLTFIVSTLSLAQAQTKNTAVKPGAAIIASLTSQTNNANSLQLGDIITDRQSGNGLQLTGEVLLQLTTQPTLPNWQPVITYN